MTAATHEVHVIDADTPGARDIYWYSCLCGWRSGNMSRQGRPPNRDLLCPRDTTR